MLDQVVDDTAINGRIELKYVIAASDLYLVREWIAKNAHPISGAYPDRTIFNLYFDTPELDCYDENLAGISKRIKLRLRWNDDIKTISGGKLEIKRKDGGLGFKDRFLFTEDFKIENARWRDVMRHLKKELSPHQIFRDNLNKYFVPILINSYRREYYHIQHTQLRVTIDKDHKVFSQLHRSSVNVTKNVRLGKNVIVELKFPPKNINWVKSVLRGLPVLRTRSSKYVQGLEAIL